MTLIHPGVRRFREFLTNIIVCDQANDLSLSTEVERSCTSVCIFWQGRPVITPLKWLWIKQFRMLYVKLSWAQQCGCIWSFVAFVETSVQIKSLLFVTSPQHKCLGEWNSYERAPDSVKKKKNYIMGQYIFTDCTEDMCKYTYIYSVP